MSGMAGYRLADDASKTMLKRKVLKPDYGYSEEEEARGDGGSGGDEYDDLKLKRMRHEGGGGTTRYTGGIMKVSDEKIPKLDGKLGSYYNDTEPFGPRWLESIYIHMAKYYQDKFVKFCSQVAGNLAWTLDQVMDNSDQPSLVRQAAIESLIAKTSDTLKKISAETAKLNKPAQPQTKPPVDTDPMKSNVPLKDVESEAGKRNKSKRKLPDRFSKKDLFMWLLEGDTLNQAHVSMVEKIFEQEGDLHFRWLQMPEIGRWIRLSETMTAAIEYCHNDLLNDRPDLYSIDDLIVNYKDRFAEMVEKRIRIVKSTRFTTDKGMEVIKTEYVRVKRLLQQLIGIRPREQVSSFIYPPGSFYTIQDTAFPETFRTPLPVRKKKETPEVERKFL